MRLVVQMNIKHSIKYLLLQDYVRLRQFLGRALQLAQAKGPSAAAISSNVHKIVQINRLLHFLTLCRFTLCRIFDRCRLTLARFTPCRWTLWHLTLGRLTLCR